jgi:hypothetical protein
MLTAEFHGQFIREVTLINHDAFLPALFDVDVHEKDW